MTRWKTTTEAGRSRDEEEFEQAVQAAAEKAETTITIVSSKPGTGSVTFLAKPRP